MRGQHGTHILLSNSDALVNYQLYMGGSTLISTIAGAGHALDFGAQPASGVYTIAATNTNGGCVANMTGSVTVTMNALPAASAITAPFGNSFCAGGAGVVLGLSGSVPGVSYQLYQGTAAYGFSLPGTGAAFNFTASPAMASGVYTAVATNTVTGCSSNMTAARQ